MEKVVVASFIFTVGIVGWLGLAYIGYVFWRDSRLDAEDEKHDRIRDEQRA